MAAATGKARCITCEKEKSTVRCDGCSQPFCYNHLGDHRQELSKQFDEIEISRDIFRQTLTEQVTKPQKHILIQEIDQWEHDSINKIRETAEEARQTIRKHTDEHFTIMEDKLNKLTNQLRVSRQENDFFETDLQQWKQQVEQLKDELNKPSIIKIIHDSTPLVTKIFLDVSISQYMPNIDVNARWRQNGVTVAGGNGFGHGLNQLWSPYSLYVDNDENVYIADYSNDRVVEWKSGATSGQIIAGGNGSGKQNNQLNSPTDITVDRENDSLLICDYHNKRVVRWPRRTGTSGETIISDVHCYGVTMDDNGYLYVTDHSKHEVKRSKIGNTVGTVIAGGNGKGDRLDQLNSPSYIFVDHDQSVYISDSGNHRVMKWMKEARQGIVVAGGHGKGNNLKQLYNPGGIFVDRFGTVYVADHKNDRIMRWLKEATQGSVIVGGNKCGTGSNQFNGSWNLSFDQQDNLYVIDYWNHRIQKFDIDLSSTA